MGVLELGSAPTRPKNRPRRKWSGKFWDRPNRPGIFFIDLVGWSGWSVVGRFLVGFGWFLHIFWSGWSVFGRFNLRFFLLVALRSQTKRSPTTPRNNLAILGRINCHNKMPIALCVIKKVLKSIFFCLKKPTNPTKNRPPTDQKNRPKKPTRPTKTDHGFGPFFRRPTKPTWKIGGRCRP